MWIDFKILELKTLDRHATFMVKLIVWDMSFFHSGELYKLIPVVDLLLQVFLGHAVLGQMNINASWIGWPQPIPLNFFP